MRLVSVWSTAVWLVLPKNDWLTNPQGSPQAVCCHLRWFPYWPTRLYWGRWRQAWWRGPGPYQWTSLRGKPGSLLLELGWSCWLAEGPYGTWPWQSCWAANENTRTSDSMFKQETVENTWIGRTMESRQSNVWLDGLEMGFRSVCLKESWDDSRMTPLIN